MLNKLKKVMIMVMMCLFMSAAVPAAEAYASQVQTETRAVQEEQADQAEDEESAFFLLMMGGGLLIILFAVISAMSTVSGAISVAVNMDVDGE